MDVKYSLQLKRGGQGRIRTRLESVNGSPVRWEYRYDNAGRLAEVRRDGSGVERYLYDGQGRRAEDYLPLRGSGGRVFRYGPDNRLLQAGDARYEHDARGFRSRRVGVQGETRYHYAPDYRLLAVELPDGRTVEYGHDDQGLRNAKYVDGRLTERFHWHDRTHLAAWLHVDMADGQWWQVVYAQDGRPVGLVAQGQVQGQDQRQSGEILLHTDQIGSVRVVEFPTEGMVKEILYDAFGNVVKDGNPYLRSPLGFAGGLHDGDTGLVRFGWRDYDPDTGRFTAQDPIGNAGGDPDWYGYCLDDPVNGRDPEGLDTRGLGGGVSLSGFGGSVGGSVMVSEDDEGQRVLEGSFDYGASSDWGVSATTTYQHSNANSVQQHDGYSTKTGASVSIPGTPLSIGAEHIDGGSYTGTNCNGSYSFKVGSGMPQPQLPKSASVKRERTFTFKIPQRDDRDDIDLW